SREREAFALWVGFRDPKRAQAVLEAIAAAGDVDRAAREGLWKLAYGTSADDEVEDDPAAQVQPKPPPPARPDPKLIRVREDSGPQTAPIPALLKRLAAKL